MGPESRFDFVEVVRDLDRRGIRFFVFGRQAMRARGAPVFTQDYDFWFDPDSRETALDYFGREKGFDLGHARTEKPPIVKVIAGRAMIDAWFVRGMSNRHQKRLAWEEIYERSVVMRDDVTGLSFRIPAIDDMIALKQMGERVRPHDEEDIRWLLAARELDREGRLPPDEPSGE